MARTPEPTKSRPVSAGGMSRDAVGLLFGISGARVWQIERRALRKIRRRIEAQAEAAGVSIDQWIADLVRN